MPMKATGRNPTVEPSLSWKPVSIDPPGVARSTRAMPWRMLRVAMVATTGESRRPRMRVPLKTPTASPTPRHSTNPMMTSGADFPSTARKEAVTTVRLITEPTEMSKPPTSSALSCAMATSASGMVLRTRLWMLENARNVDDRLAV